MFDLRVFIFHLLTQFASQRRHCRMCGAEPLARSKWCGSECQQEYQDFYALGH